LLLCRSTNELHICQYTNTKKCNRSGHRILDLASLDVALKDDDVACVLVGDRNLRTVLVHLEVAREQSTRRGQLNKGQVAIGFRLERHDRVARDPRAVVRVQVCGVKDRGVAVGCDDEAVVGRHGNLRSFRINRGFAVAKGADVCDNSKGQAAVRNVVYFIAHNSVAKLVDNKEERVS
jgi:hypothetical protein